MKKIPNEPPGKATSPSLIKFPHKMKRFGMPDGLVRLPTPTAFTHTVAYYRLIYDNQMESNGIDQMESKIPLNPT